MKLLITSRSFGDSKEALEILENAGYVCDRYFTGERKVFDPEVFAALIKEYDALVIGAEDFPPELLAECPNLKIILKPGTGINNIPVRQAVKQGIKVVAAPGVNAQAVADLTFGLIIACARNICIGYTETKAGNWSRNKKMLTGVDVYQKNIGILGFGNIGKSVARRARGFSMHVLAYDPYLPELPEEFRSYAELTENVDDVIRRADFLSIHLPLTEETKNCINKHRISKMKDGAVIINTSRGGIVNETDLYHAIVSGKISAAGLDVTMEEPVQINHPLLSLPQVIITPHIASYSKEASTAVVRTTAENAAKFARGEEIESRYLVT